MGGKWKQLFIGEIYELHLAARFPRLPHAAQGLGLLFASSGEWEGAFPSAWMALEYSSPWVFVAVASEQQTFPDFFSFSLSLRWAHGLRRGAFTSFSGVSEWSPLLAGPPPGVWTSPGLLTTQRCPMVSPPQWAGRWGGVRPPLRASKPLQGHGRGAGACGHVPPSEGLAARPGLLSQVWGLAGETG